LAAEDAEVVVTDEVSSQVDESPGQPAKKQPPTLPRTQVEAEATPPEAEPQTPQPPEQPEPVPPGGLDFERALESAGNESVISADRIEQNITRGLTGIFRYEPGVQVQSSTGRFGETSINIRGLEGNRVLISVDGVRSPDAFLQGPIQLGRNVVDVNLLKQVEIVRGPGSLIYGEGAIGGVVAFETKDPVDFLNIVGQDSYFGYSQSYFSVDQSWAETPVIALRTGDLETLLAYTRRDGSELDTAGTFGPDPQDIGSDYMLGKLVYHVDANNELDFAVEWYNQGIETNLRSTLADPLGSFNTFATTPEVFPGALPASRFLADADDENRRLRYSLTHDYDSESDGWLSRARVQIYFQEASINDARLQQFLVPAVVPPFVPPRHIIDDLSSNFFDQEHFGGRIILRGDVESARIKQSLVYGVDALRTDTGRLRTGIVTNEATGATVNSNQISEVTPLKVLPDVTTTRVGMFFRDRIDLENCPFTVTPGVRVNYYRADFDVPDPLFDDSSGTPNDVSEWNAQPAIELSTFIVPRLESVVRYARGYRGPPVEDAGIGFTNPLFGYTVVPNVNLTSETSDSVDFGLSLNHEVLAAYAGGYYNHYNDYIDTAALGLDPNTGLIVFQQQNLDAQIYGVEFAGELRLVGDYYDPPSRRSSLERRGGSDQQPRQEFYGLSAFANFTHSVGDNLDADIPLDSIPPLYSVVGLRYRALENRWGVEFLSTLVHRKDRYSGAIPDQFIPPGYGVFDLLAYANVSDRLQINAGMFNIFDREYYQWLNIRGVENSQRDLTRFAAPGANFGVTVRLHW
jgi:hemoglobin/transferrin/lactoferrin receptor protein